MHNSVPHTASHGALDDSQSWGPLAARFAGLLAGIALLGVAVYLLSHHIALPAMRDLNVAYDQIKPENSTGLAFFPYLLFFFLIWSAPVLLVVATLYVTPALLFGFGRTIARTIPLVCLTLFDIVIWALVLPGFMDSVVLRFAH